MAGFRSWDYLSYAYAFKFFFNSSHKTKLLIFCFKRTFYLPLAGSAGVTWQGYQSVLSSLSRRFARLRRHQPNYARY